MRFKNGIYYKVEHFKSYEIDLPKEDVIYRLSEQDGICRNQDNNGYPLEFVCFKNGHFFVKDPGEINRQSFLQGYVESENEKTIVNVEIVKDKSSLILSVIRSVISLVVAVVGIVLLLLKGGIGEAKSMMGMILLLVMPVLSISLDFKEKKAIPVDIEIMLTEVENRINGVIRWDD